MALRNVMFLGSYAVVKCLQVDARACNAQLFVDVYTDTSKQTLVQRMCVVYQAEAVKVATALATTPPETPAEGDVYLVVAGAGEWAGVQNASATFRENRFEFMSLYPREVVYDSSTGKYYRFENGAVAEIPVAGKAEFDSYFGVAVQSTDGQNVYSRAYEYLKTLPQFAGAIDE